MRARRGEVTELESTLFPGLRPEKVAPAGQFAWLQGLSLLGDPR